MSAVCCAARRDVESWLGQTIEIIGSASVPAYQDSPMPAEAAG
jgi:hypothetical protein